MAEYARVENLDELKHLAEVLRKFKDRCSTALSDAEGEIHRVRGWLERDQPVYWQAQLKKRRDALEDAKNELRNKTLYKNVDGTRSSAIEERKKVQKITRAVEEAQQKLANIKRWHVQLEREVMQYKSQVQHLVHAVEMDIPRAVAKIEAMIVALERYLATTAAAAGAPAMSVSEALASMARDGQLPSMARDGEDDTDPQPRAEATEAENDEGDTP
jgi:chromosome segregation ATPase